MEFMKILVNFDIIIHAYTKVNYFLPLTGAAFFSSFLTGFVTFGVILAILTCLILSKTCCFMAILSWIFLVKLTLFLIDGSNFLERLVFLLSFWLT